MSVTLHRMVEVSPPAKILEPGRYMIANGDKCLLSLRLYRPTTPDEMMDMIEAMRRAEAA